MITYAPDASFGVNGSSTVVPLLRSARRETTGLIYAQAVGAEALLPTLELDDSLQRQNIAPGPELSWESLLELDQLAPAQRAWRTRAATWVHGGATSGLRLFDADGGQSEASLAIVNDRPLMQPRGIGRHSDPAATRLLTPDLRKLISTVDAMVITSSHRAGIPVKRISIDAFTDPEEAWTNVSLTVSVACPAAHALAFWDYLGDRIDRWRNTLSEESAAQLSESLAVYVDWE